MNGQADNSRERILLTGGAGFLGSALAARLADAANVVIYDNLARNSWRFLPEEVRARTRLVRGDILDSAALREAVRGVDVVVHLAAIAGVSNYYQRPYEVMRVNLGGTLALLGALAECRPRRLVFVSSSEVYGTEAAHAKEDDPLWVGDVHEPRWTYALSKIAGEKACLAWGRQQGVVVHVLRPFNVFGPGQTGEGAVRDMALAALAGREVVVHGDGAQTRAWCDVEDFVDAAVSVLRTDGPGQVFNVGHPGNTVSARGLAEQIVALAGTGAPIVTRPHFGVDIPHRAPVIDRAQAVLGFSPHVALADGLRRAVEWYREHAARC